jgi:hypothetical protein
VKVGCCTVVCAMANDATANAEINNEERIRKIKKF